MKKCYIIVAFDKENKGTATIDQTAYLSKEKAEEVASADPTKFCNVVEFELVE